ncbi:hypothetical protein M0813_08181 [Anaeramoeba flamelloides]|uniref:Uncharacterized protein n=1 Tax=Anaeramoeba flamelloides TaxID=1746091 RepID=A0ABQ8X8S1_9EUKA|nr:hypothetical protein M0813_08181 [Anaeramoeba flamelloides]
MSLLCQDGGFLHSKEIHCKLATMMVHMIAYDQATIKYPQKKTTNNNNEQQQHIHKTTTTTTTYPQQQLIHKKQQSTTTTNNKNLSTKTTTNQLIHKNIFSEFNLI